MVVVWLTRITKMKKKLPTMKKTSTRNSAHAKKAARKKVAKAVSKVADPLDKPEIIGSVASIVKERDKALAENAVLKKGLTN